MICIYCETIIEHRNIPGSDLPDESALRIRGPPSRRQNHEFIRILPRLTDVHADSVEPRHNHDLRHHHLNASRCPSCVPKKGQDRLDDHVDVGPVARRTRTDSGSDLADFGTADSVVVSALRTTAQSCPVFQSLRTAPTSSYSRFDTDKSCEYT